jgi:hypothetical protein
VTAPRSFFHDLPRKQLLLLSLAVLLPSALLVFLGARTVFQEREFTEKRVLDQHRAMADDIGRGLLVELRRVAAYRMAISRASDAALKAWGELLVARALYSSSRRTLKSVRIPATAVTTVNAGTDSPASVRTIGQANVAIAGSHAIRLRSRSARAVQK